MSRVKQIQEQIVEKRNALLAIDEKCENENRARTPEEKEQFNALKNELADLNNELVDAKDAEELRKAKADADAEARKAALAAGGSVSNEGEQKELGKVAKNMSARDFIMAVAGRGEIDGAIKEMDQEARNEVRNFGNPASDSINIPSKLLIAAEKRATVDQANSAIQPTMVSGYVDELRENAIYEQVGVNVMSDLSADYKMVGVGKNSLAWATAENSAAADGGDQFDKHTLAPVRLTGYVPVSNKIFIQGGESPFNAIFRDLGRETANKIDAALWATSSVTNAPASIPATSGVGTFTEAATYAANSTVLQDFVAAEQTLADAQGLSGRLGYIAATNLMSELKKSAQVASVIPAFGQGGIPTNGAANINGYMTLFTVAATKSTGTSGDFLFGDFSKIDLGFFGGLSIIRDDVNGRLTDTTNIIVHRYVDWGTVRPAAFVKGTSLVA